MNDDRFGPAAHTCAPRRDATGERHRFVPAASRGRRVIALRDGRRRKSQSDPDPVSTVEFQRRCTRMRDRP
jgi:hypothetical protein